MSLSQTVTKSVDEVIHNFIQQLANKYNLDANELLAEWEGKSSGKKTNMKPAKKSLILDLPNPDEDVDHDVLLKCKKPELQAMCRQKGIKCTGTKAQLVGYLLGKEPVSAKKLAKKKVTPKKKVSATPVAKKLTSDVKTFEIRRNQFGNHEHPDTSFIFNKKTKKVIGKQNDDGAIDDLSPEDIDVCNQYKFPYELPSNLDKGMTLDDINVDELNDDELDDEEIMESEEEEVILDEEELIDDGDFENKDEFEEEFEDDDYE